MRFQFPHKKFITFDFETESLNLRNNRPWQLFFMVNHGEKEILRRNYYLKFPNLKVSAMAAKVTGFNIETVRKQGVDPEMALKEFETYLYDPEYCIVGANVIGFDTYVHNYYRHLYNRKPDFSWLERLYDTNSIAKGFKLGIQKTKEENLLAYQVRMRSIVKKGLKTSIQALVDEYKLTYVGNLHDAAVDTPLCFEIFKRLIQQAEI